MKLGDYVGPPIPGHPGRWRITSLLGRGGMASVYEAEDLVLNRRRVAIKVAPASSPEAVARFTREVKTLAGLEHPAIVRIADSGEQMISGEHVTYMVMEKLVGKTVEDRLEDAHEQMRLGDGWSWKMPFSMRELCMVMGYFAHALAAAHAKGIVHRDIKPSNLFLVRNPDGTTAPKMIDFGIARRLFAEAARKTSRLTTDGAIMGTPYYMPPEQLQGEDVGPAVDQFALAAVMYELLTGVVPYNPPVDADKNISQVMLFRLMAIQKGPDTWIERLPESVPIEVRELLRKALQSSPTDRFLDIFAMCRKLYQLADLPEPEAPIAPPLPGDETESLPIPVPVGVQAPKAETLSPIVTGRKGVVPKATSPRGFPTLTVGLGVLGVAAAIVGVGALMSGPSSTSVPPTPRNGVRVSVLDVPPPPPSLPRPPPPRVEDSGVAPRILAEEDAGDAPEDSGVEAEDVAETDSGFSPRPARRPHRRAQPTAEEARARSVQRALERQCCEGTGIAGVVGAARCPPAPGSADYRRLRCGHR